MGVVAAPHAAPPAAGRRQTHCRARSECRWWGSWGRRPSPPPHSLSLRTPQPPSATPCPSFPRARCSRLSAAVSSLPRSCGCRRRAWEGPPARASPDCLERGREKLLQLQHGAHLRARRRHKQQPPAEGATPLAFVPRGGARALRRAPWRLSGGLAFRTAHIPGQPPLPKDSPATAPRSN